VNEELSRFGRGGGGRLGHGMLRAAAGSLAADGTRARFYPSTALYPARSGGATKRRGFPRARSRS
jgi:hypothetical protein